MAKGKFSQPRQPRHETDDFEAVYHRPRPNAAAERPIEPTQKIPVRDASLEETQVLTEDLFSQQMIHQDTVPEDPFATTVVSSFEESQFLNETASFQPELPLNEEESYEEDDDEEYEETPRSSRYDQNRKKLLIAICAAALLLLIAIIIGLVLFFGSNADDGLILNNVTIAGVNVGGMTPEEAEKAVHRATDLTYTNESMIVHLPDTTLELSPADTGVKLDVSAAVEAAYNYGRSGTREENKKAQADAQISTHIIALLPYLNLDTDYIRQVLNDYGADFNSSYAASSFTLEGEMPELDGEKFDENAPCQTLILNPGTPGRNLNLDKVYNDILDAYSLNVFVVEAEMSAPEETPEALDLDAIYEALHLDPVDATMDMETFEVTMETYGYTFDLEEAKKLLEDTVYGETLSIPMEYVVPDVLSTDLDGKIFGDELAYYETKHTDDSNRNHNLKLACEAINGYVLDPGETFDYNEVLGERTEKAGYKPAGALNAGTSITEVGGGICQVSSTLYYCTLLADLEIVDRRSHSLVSTYIPMGMDATVSWGGPEFRFKNNTDYPIRIDAEVSGGYVKIALMGTDEKDYYVEMEYKIVEVLEPQTEEKVYKTTDDIPDGYYDGKVIQNGITGYTVYTYKCKYDKETDELISKDYEATSNYVRKNKIVVVIEEPEEDSDVETEATTAPTTAPTEAPTEPTETTAPPTEATTPATEPASVSDDTDSAAQETTAPAA